MPRLVPPRTAAFAFLLLPLAIPAPAPAQAPPTQRAVEDLLPASSYASVRFGGLAACRSAVEQMPMTALVQDVLGRMPAETLDQRVHVFLDRAADHLRDHLQQAGIRPATLRAVLARPMALGIGRPTLHGYGPSAALVVDAGPARQDLEEMLAAGERLVRQLDERVQTGRQQIAGIDVRTLRGDSGPTMLWGWVGDHLVLTNSPGYLAEIAGVAAGKVQSMAHTSSLGTARGNLPQPALAGAFVNLRPLMGALDPFLPYEAAELGALLGWSGCDGVFLGASGAPEGAADVLHLGMPGSERGLLKTAFRGPVSLQAARYCSAEAVAFAAGSLDLPAVVDAFQAFVDALPDEARAEIRREMQRELRRELRRELGMTPEALDALIRAFGSNVAIGVDLQKGTNLPEVLLFAEAKDMAQVGPVLAQLEQTIAREAGTEWKVRKAGDAEIRYCNVNAGFALSPCWVHRDGMVIFGSHTQALLAALKRAEKTEGTLATTTDFQRVAADCGDASALVHLRLKTGAELAWRTVEGMLRSLADANAEMLGFDGNVVPDAEHVAKAVGTTTFSVQVDDHGVLLRHRGTLALGAWLATFGRLADEVLDRACTKVF